MAQTYVVNNNKKIVRYILLGALAVLIIMVFSSSFYTIRSTERGVLSTFGKMSDEVIEDGLHLKIPFIQSIKRVNVQQKKFDGRENSYTRDVQTSEVEYTINYDLVRENVSKLMKNVGDDYHNRIVVPFIRSAILPPPRLWRTATRCAARSSNSFVRRWMPIISQTCSSSW